MCSQRKRWWSINSVSDKTLSMRKHIRLKKLYTKLIFKDKFLFWLHSQTFSGHFFFDIYFVMTLTSLHLLTTLHRMASLEIPQHPINKKQRRIATHLSLHVQFLLIRLEAIFCGGWKTFHRFDWLTIIDVAPSARIRFKKKIVLQAVIVSRA